MCTARFDGKPAELSETLHFFFIFCLLTHSRYPYFYPLDGVFYKVSFDAKSKSLKEFNFSNLRRYTTNKLNNEN